MAVSAAEVRLMLLVIGSTRVHGTDALGGKGSHRHGSLRRSRDGARTVSKTQLGASKWSPWVTCALPKHRPRVHSLAWLAEFGVEVISRAWSGFYALITASEISSHEL